MGIFCIWAQLKSFSRTSDGRNGVHMYENKYTTGGPTSLVVAKQRFSLRNLVWVEYINVSRNKSHKKKITKWYFI